MRLHVVPFLDEMHSSSAMERFLTDSGAVKQNYPPPIISLALLKERAGDLEAACRLLSDLSAKTTGAWQKRVDKMAERLNCKQREGK